MLSGGRAAAAFDGGGPRPPALIDSKVPKERAMFPDRDCSNLLGRGGSCIVLLLCFAAVAPPATAGERKEQRLEIRTLSNRADLVSGGDVLVEIGLPPHTRADEVRVELNGRDVRHQFAIRADGRFLGLLNGLSVGKNKLVASIRGQEAQRLTITNHPIGGPIFSGPPVQPWICSTVEAGLGQPQDAQCNAPTQVTWFYRSTNPAVTGFLPYNPSAPPADVRTTTTDQGITVPYIVRLEQGTLNRSIYSFAVLFDPSRPALPWASPRGWNHKLYYLLEGGALPKHIQSLPV